MVNRLKDEGFTLLAMCLQNPSASPQIFGLIISNMEDASDSSLGVAPLINNVALPGSLPSLPVSVTGCKSHPAANKKVEASGEKLLPTALPPSEPKVDQKLPRSSKRRGKWQWDPIPRAEPGPGSGRSGSGRRGGASRREADPPGRQGLPELAAFVVVKVDKWQSACSQGSGANAGGRGSG